MVDRVTFTTPESGANPPAAPVADPNLPEENPSDLAKSYAELRAKFTQTSQELSALKKGTEAPADPAAPPADPVTPPTEAPKPDASAPQTPAEAAEQIAAEGGFDLNPYQNEYIETGDVSEKGRAELAEFYKDKLGDDARSLVDQFIEGQKAVHANQRNDFYNAAGGEENYNTMLEFARATMTDAERNAFNTAINGQDHAGRMLALEGLKSKYEAENGVIPNLIRPGSQSHHRGGLAPFANSAQMTAAMADPRYASDQSYRDQVRDRIAISPNL